MVSRSSSRVAAGVGQASRDTGVGVASEIDQLREARGPMYDDDYATCARTYATLRIYPGDGDPAEVTDRLGIEPSSWQRRGEVSAGWRRRGEAAPLPGIPSSIATLSGWFLTSQDRVASRDSGRHVDWLLEHLASRAEAIRSLQGAGCRMDILCFWQSRSGQGGPTISPSQMRGLGALDIELGFDIHGPIEENDAPAAPETPDA